MVQFRKVLNNNFFYKKKLWYSILIVIFFIFLRFNKSLLFIESIRFVSEPFTQKINNQEWLSKGSNIEQRIKIDILEKDNMRLRNILSLQSFSENNKISAAVISRKINGWWQQFYINKGSVNGIKIGDAVIAPGGLIGVINQLSLQTAKVELLTSPSSKVGVWANRIERHGMLIGMGTNRPKVEFLDKDTVIKTGDFITTSPASVIFPPNITIGIVQSVGINSSQMPYAIIQLLASPEATDWVQVLINK
tara:strand:- start:1757 stop:2503 length:747 start_codon:yes stop_codon:yes gene_type:complete